MSDLSPIQVPAWFTNAELPAPCLCGRALQPGEPYLLAEESSSGGKRWFHLMCWQMLHDFDDDDLGL